MSGRLMKNRFIIEHPTRGTLKSIDHDGTLHFSLTGSRNDPEKTWHFTSLESAQKVLETLPGKLQSKATIRSEAEHWEVAGSTVYNYKVRGEIFEAGETLIVYDTVFAHNEDEAKQLMSEDYPGEGYIFKVHGVIQNKQDEKKWLAYNAS